jgi:predicted ATP-binding protein involved in virulence
LKQFRCFSELTVQLHPELSVFVAENAKGKTALLDAIAIALDVFVARLAFRVQSRGLNRTDVHLDRKADGGMSPHLPAQISATGFAAGKSVGWSRQVTHCGATVRTSTRNTRDMRILAENLRQSIEPQSTDTSMGAVVLPLVAYFRTDRWREYDQHSDTRRFGRTVRGRLSGYLDWLSSSSSYRKFEGWYEERANAAKSSLSTAEPSYARPERQLAAIRNAVRTVLAPTGWTDIDWQFPERDAEGLPQGRGMLVVEHSENGKLPLRLLSDGIRNMISLVADIAYRCISLNPHFGELAAARTPGILIVDEVDMHLHPRWQQLVIDLLRRAFPALQMILTTHSPHVLSTVDFQSVSVISVQNGQGAISQPEFQTRGVESADVLAKVMNVDPIPQVDEARWLSDYRVMVQTDTFQTDAAGQLWERLLAHFGPNHPVLIEVETLRRLQEFKRLHHLQTKAGE